MDLVLYLEVKIRFFLKICYIMQYMLMISFFIIYRNK